ncbi:MAG: dTDP-4-dehydrorhamnose reductase [Planctomycetota bacterium]|jgi:dTDP-4-dehydrorhamnose reductase/4-ketoreductase
MSRFAVLGSRGMLGRALCEELDRRGEEYVGVDLPEIDIADSAAVAASIADKQPEVLLNAAAYTDVDGAESEPDAAARANVDGPRAIAECARDHDTLLVHVSTDYVFGGVGTEPYTEDAPTAPKGVYAETKLAGEEAVRASGARHLIVRTAWLYAPWGRNFVRTILGAAREGRELRVVDDQRGSPTYAPDLAEAILDLAESGETGTFHAVNSDEATWFDLAAEAVKLAGMDVPIARVTTAEFPRPAPRPAYSVLSTAKLLALGAPMRPWREALAECVAELAKAEA